MRVHALAVARAEGFCVANVETVARFDTYKLGLAVEGEGFFHGIDDAQHMACGAACRQRLNRFGDLFKRAQRIGDDNGFGERCQSDGRGQWLIKPSAIRCQSFR